MLKTCEMCSNEFITESDPYVVNPRPSGVKYYCSCMIKEGNETLFETNRKLQAENAKLRECVKWYADPKNCDNIDFAHSEWCERTEEEIADAGFRARQCLKELEEK